MSIADKLTYLNGTKNLLREAINAAGGNLTQEAPFREYAGGWLRDQSASLNLDFSKQQYVAKDKVSMFPDRVGFEDIVSFTRSTGGGRFNAQGEYEWLPANTPRIDYNPVTGECLGLLVEEQRANLIANSESSGVGVTLFNATLETSDITSPSGMGNFLYLRENTGTGFHQLAFPVSSILPETSYTFSLYIHKMSVGSRSIGILPFNSSAVGGTATRGVWLSPAGEFLGYAGAGIDPGHYIQDFGDYYRVCVTGKTVVGGRGHPTVRLQVGTYEGDGNSGLYYWGAQFEQGSFPSSYIPTEGAQVTRAADNAIVNELSPWYNSDQGSFSIKAKGHTGEPMLTVGDASIIADSDEMEEYQVSYSEDPQATQVDIGKGLVESIRYWPRETA